MATELNGKADDATMVAHHFGEALEYVERARGHLFEFHHLIGHADGMLDEVLRELNRAHRPELTAAVRDSVYGRSVLADRWTYEIVEDFDDGYYAAWRRTDQLIRDALTDGRRHVHEAQMKADRQAKGVDPGA